MNYITVTNADTGTPIVVNIDNISTVEAGASCSVIFMTGGYSVHCTESVDDVTRLIRAQRKE